MSRRTRLLRKKSRRGIILLVTISLLTLFVLIAVTYALVATVYRDSANAQSKRGLVQDDWQREADDVMYRIVRDTDNKDLGSLTGGSLLNDVYGSDGFNATVTGSALENAGQVIRIAVTTNVATHKAPQPFVSGAFTMSTYDDAYTGSVLTFTTGNLKGMSTRILRYIASGNVFYVVAPQTDRTPGFTPVNGDVVLVNGRPFNGTGVGYNPTTATLDATEVVATNPEPVALLMRASATGFSTGTLRGADEPYDAPDIQNPFLGFMVRDNTGAVTSLIPSYHRPALINYWIQQKGVGAFNNLAEDLQKRISLRPISTPSTNPNFTGSNPNYNPVNGPWDVDNDNDGIPDSIWIDPGLPVMTAPNGRLYKRLAAILILDMDGRININSMGSPQLDAPSAPGYNANYLAETPLGPTYLPRGLGFGAAEVRFRNLFTNDTEYLNILTNRYGTDGIAGQATRYFWELKFQNFPRDFYQLPPVASAAGNPAPYFSPPDLWGRGAIALDGSGQPVMIYNADANELTNNPYHSNGGMKNLPYDYFYSPADQEALLRMNDLDATSLSKRLTTLAPSLVNNPRERNLVTTVSSHIPVPTLVLPKELRQAATNPSSVSIMDLYVQRLSGSAAAKQTTINRILPWEFRLGRKFNLNRVFGNGVDDNNDGVADDILEAAAEKAWASLPANYPNGFPNSNSWASNGTDVNFDNTVDATDQLLARHLYARHLYCLAWAMYNSKFVPNFANYNPPENLTPAQSNQLFARRLAQWAINVVDFRDPDSIMTPFEYDTNPADGWSVDGDIRTTTDGGNQRGVVWGVEAPDLLITEAKAMHDKRLKDTKFDNVRKTKIGPGNNDDKDVDQYRMPQGSLFVEFYCPKTRVRTTSGSGRPSQYPNELYVYDSSNNVPRLDLGRTVNGVPVWQVVVSENLVGSAKAAFSPEQLAVTHPWSGGFDPVQTTILPGNIPAANQLVIDRRLWFTNQAPTDALANRTFYNMRGWSAAVAPGQYMVMGPRDTTYMGSVDKNVSGATSDWGGNARQYVKIQPNQATYVDLTGNTTNKPVVGLIGEMPPSPNWTQTKISNPRWRQGMNVTEPLASGTYYPEPPDLGMGATLPDDIYGDVDAGANQLPDHPFEGQVWRNTAPYRTYPLNVANMYEVGTYLNSRAVYLQRLADPSKNFDAVTNPYITVDWATVDVTVFNGEDNEPAGGPSIRFASRERGYKPNNNPGYPNANPYFPLANNPPNSTATGTTTGEYWQYNLGHTFGGLNQTVDMPNAQGEPNNSPFPWITWNNRPFASPAELLLVPSSQASRMFGEMPFLPNLQTGNTTPINPYIANNLFQPFGHLMNFFTSTNSTNTNDTSAPDFFRIFDMVETPSPYAETEMWLNPSSGSNQFGDPTVTAVSQYYRPPFNAVSTFREPGRVNINTIGDFKVWEALTKQYPALATANFFDQLIRSRQGYGSAGTGYSRDSNYPTEFANPFRPSTAADLAPLPNMRLPLPVNSTLLRMNPDVNTEPLFASSSTVTQYGTTGLISKGKFNDTDRNPYFRYQPLQKISNLVSTQSNCFSMWITIGYFEVDPVTGFIGQELGADSGEIKRHRAFYMIDRSIPVAFEPGENHNVDRAILLRRMIE